MVVLRGAVKTHVSVGRCGVEKSFHADWLGAYPTARVRDDLILEHFFPVPR